MTIYDYRRCLEFSPTTSMAAGENSLQRQLKVKDRRCLEFSPTTRMGCRRYLDTSQQPKFLAAAIEAGLI